MRFVPDDKGQLDAMFVAMTYCQSQHPPDDQLSGEKYKNPFLYYFNASSHLYSTV